MLLYKVILPGASAIYIYIENPMIFSVLGQLKGSLKYVTGTNEEIQKYVNKFFSFAAIYTVNKGVVVEN